MQEHCKYLDTVAWNTLLKIIIRKYSKFAERIGPCILKNRGSFLNFECGCLFTICRVVLFVTVKDPSSFARSSMCVCLQNQDIDVSCFRD